MDEAGIRETLGDIGGETARPSLHRVASEAPHQAPSQAAPQASAPDPEPAAPEGKSGGLRRPLLLAGPIVALVLALLAYLTGGRYAETDDSYVKADIVNVANDVSGMVAEVEVKEGQLVKKGDLLFHLDDAPYKIARDGAQAHLGVVADQLRAAKANYAQSRALIAQAKADLVFFGKTKDRQSDLVARKVSAQANLDQAVRDYNGAQSRFISAQRQEESLLALLGGKPDEPVESYPQYRQAKAELDKAERDLRRTRILAPISGIATNVPRVQPGNYLSASQTAINIVSHENMWVDAHLKETDLAHVKVGDPATISVDTYGGRIWKAHVTSIAPATGSEFSVLPPQNTSGNWVKVVQRLTVRLAIDPEPDAPQLRAGMSVTASVDTGVKRSLATLPRDLMHLIGF